MSASVSRLFRMEPGGDGFFFPEAQVTREVPA
jgi:hypothetical protein